MTVLNLDEGVPEAVMNEIRSANHVIEAKLIKL